MGTGQTIGAHTGAGTQYADTVETGAGSDGPACILHMPSHAYGKWGPLVGEKCSSAACVMLGWVARMASVTVRSELSMKSNSTEIMSI